MISNKEWFDSLKRQRKNMIDASVKAKQGHLSPSFSVLEILNVLYKKIMIFDTKNYDSEDNDVCILSKGHASLGLYALLLDLGVLKEEEFYSFSKFDSILGEHPDRNKIPSVKASTGSLGHGLPIGVGIATAFLSQAKKNKVYVIIGDGEANEGSIWESALIAERLNLSNLTCVVDNNHSESYSPYLVQKFSAFGWDVIEIPDGNNLEQINEALSVFHNKPIAIIANTKKGFGSKTMMEDPEGWHHRFKNELEYKKIMEELL